MCATRMKGIDNIDETQIAQLQILILLEFDNHVGFRMTDSNLKSLMFRKSGLQTYKDPNNLAIKRHTPFTYYFYILQL